MLSRKYYPVVVDGRIYKSIVDLIEAPPPPGRPGLYNLYWWIAAQTSVSFIGTPVPAPVSIFGNNVFLSGSPSSKQFSFPDPESALLWANEVVGEWAKVAKLDRLPWDAFLRQVDSAAPPTRAQIELFTQNNAIAGIARVTSRQEIAAHIPVGDDDILFIWRSLAKQQVVQFEIGGVRYKVYPLEASRDACYA